MLSLGIGLGLNGGGSAGDPTLALDLDFTTGSLDAGITFTRATSATYYNSSGVLTTAASGAARFDHDPVTLEPLGLLREEARTNRCLHSADFSNAVWAKTNITVTANDASGPFGTTTADLLTATGANATVIQDLGVVASAAKSGAVYIKRKTGTGNIDLTLDGGVTWTTKTITSAWTRFSITQTLADEDFGIRIATSGDEIWVEAADVQTGAYITTHIPTTTAAVTRNADQVSMTGTNFSDWWNAAVAGTVYAEFTQDGASSALNQRLFSITNGTDTYRMQYNEYVTGSNAYYADNATTSLLNAGAPPALGTSQKIALAFAENDLAIVRDGGTPVTDASQSMATVFDRLIFGDTLATVGGAVHIKAFRFYNVRKSNADLQALTA